MSFKFVFTNVKNKKIDFTIRLQPITAMTNPEKNRDDATSKRVKMSHQRDCNHYKSSAFTRHRTVYVCLFLVIFFCLHLRFFSSTVSFGVTFDVDVCCLHFICHSPKNYSTSFSHILWLKTFTVYVHFNIRINRVYPVNRKVQKETTSQIKYEKKKPYARFKQANRSVKLTHERVIVTGRYANNTGLFENTHHIFVHLYPFCLFLLKH